MATEKQANIARNKHKDLLDTLGAHSVGVDQVTQQGKKTFAVIAYTEKKGPKMPEHLEITEKGKSLKVPLVVQVEEKFKLE